MMSIDGKGIHFKNEAEGIYALEIILNGGFLLTEKGNYSEMKRLHERIVKAIKDDSNETVEYYDGDSQNCIVIKNVQHIKLFKVEE